MGLTPKEQSVCLRDDKGRVWPEDVTRGPRKSRKTRRQRGSPRCSRLLRARLSLLKDPNIQVPARWSLIGSAAGQRREHRGRTEHHLESLEEHLPESSQ